MRRIAPRCRILRTPARTSRETPPLHDSSRAWPFSFQASVDGRLPDQTAAAGRVRSEQQNLHFLAAAGIASVHQGEGLVVASSGGLMRPSAALTTLRNT